MNKGFVYILQNASMPGMVKIGKTTRTADQRCQELYMTGVPLPFSVACCVASPDCHALEQAMHNQFAQERVTAGREFFRLSVDVARDALENHLLASTLR